jgi:hypothetical protein
MGNCDCELVSFTIIPTDPIVCPSKLSDFTIIDFQRRLKFFLNKIWFGIDMKQTVAITSIQTFKFIGAA